MNGLDELEFLLSYEATSPPSRRAGAEFKCFPEIDPRHPERYHRMATEVHAWRDPRGHGVGGGGDGEVERASWRDRETARTAGAAPVAHAGRAGRAHSFEERKTAHEGRVATSGRRSRCIAALPRAAAQHGLSDSAEHAAFIERLRRSGIRIDRDGRFSTKGRRWPTRVCGRRSSAGSIACRRRRPLHPAPRRATLRLPRRRRHAAGRAVSAVRPGGDVWLGLSDGAEEALDPTTLTSMPPASCGPRPGRSAGSTARDVGRRGPRRAAHWRRRGRRRRCARRGGRWAPGARTAGRVTTKRAPPSGAGASVTLTSPPWSSDLADDRQAQPGAVLLGRDVGVEDPLRASAATPGPLSSTRMAAVPGCPLRATASRTSARGRPPRLPGRHSRPGSPAPAAAACGRTARAPRRGRSTCKAAPLRVGAGEVLDQRAEVDRDWLDLGELGEGREVVDQPPDRADLLVEDLVRRTEQVAVRRIVAAVLRAQLLHRELDRRQRVLDLVRQAPRDLLPGRQLLHVFEARPRLPQLGHHAVEGTAQIVELVAPGRRHPHRQITLPTREAASRSALTRRVARRATNRPMPGRSPAR